MGNLRACIAALVAVALTLSAAAQAQDDAADGPSDEVKALADEVRIPAADIRRFQLFNECKPVRVTARVQPPEYGLQGFDADSLKAVAEERLQVAGLHTPNPFTTPRLDISVVIYGDTHWLGLSFTKWVYDAISGLQGWATAWSYDALDDLGFSVDRLHGHVGNAVNQFLVEYLRANSAACQ